uniref:Clathrin/coatomer adaptor adaptin-like N-terminal domain-containing protein n=1 Tax=Kalanchoe fedtschenkoi TaxID=63787 RepID=A0A7N0VDM7_KALFE
MRELVREGASPKSGQFAILNCFDMGSRSVACGVKEAQGLAANLAAKFAQKEGEKAAKLVTRQAKRIVGPIISSGWDFFEVVYYGGTMVKVFSGSPRLLPIALSLVFFCKYNDPIYVKLEKLEIMIKLASDRNIDQVLLELKEYATEVDVDFVRKAVRAIGRCAIKYESIIATLCESLDTLDEPEAKAYMIWIIGEYAETIDNADELLESFLETFPEEPAQVQLQLLTATVKLFLKKPTEGPQQMIQVLDTSFWLLLHQVETYSL